MMVVLRALLVIIVLFLFTIGLMVIFSTSSAEVLDHQLPLSTYHALFRQILYGIVGLVLAVAIYRLGHFSFLQVSPFLLTLLVLLLVLVLIPGLGREVNGSKRWLAIGGLSFQPSEFMKYVLIAFFLNEYVRHPLKRNRLSFFLSTSAKCFIPLVLIMIEPNNGTVAVMGLSLVVCAILLKVPFQFWGVPLICSMLVVGVFATQLPYVKGRLRVYLNPELDIRGKGHQPYQAKIAAGSGGVFGKGPGKSMQKLSYLPEAQNDYIAAIIGEEYGFIGLFVLIFSYSLFALTGFFIAASSNDLASFSLGSAITFLVTFQAFMNLAVVSGLLPSTGLNLPFVSQGGSSLMANMAGLGLLASIASETECYRMSQTGKKSKRLA